MLSIIEKIKQGQLWDFHGGIHPAENKHISTRNTVQQAGVPDQLILPLKQHIGAKGDILVTLDAYLEKNPHLKISLLHIDVDLYEPTKVVLEKLYDRVTKGGIIIFDDYGAFAGTNKAVDDFFKNKAEIEKLPYSFSISYIVK